MAVFLEIESWTVCAAKISVLILVVFCRHCCSDSSLDDTGELNQVISSSITNVDLCGSVPSWNRGRLRIFGSGIHFM